MLRYLRKIFVQQSLFKIFFYSKLRTMSGKLKILQHFKQKKNFLYISKKKSSRNASIFAKNFCSIIAILKKNFILNCVISREN